MKNGLNIGGASEIVHEICTNAEEAIIRYGARASGVAGGASCAVRAMRLGTIRVARDFQLEVDALKRGAEEMPAAVDYLLTGLASCVMFTWVQACTMRGITILRLGIKAQGRVDPETSALGHVGYEVSIESDGADDQIVDVAKKVTCFSPNHRTFVEANDARVKLQVHDETKGHALVTRPKRSGLRAQPAKRNRELTPELAVELTWRYGAHMDARLPSCGMDLEIDQPKQLNGQDWAPNPQEYLVLALASELMLGLDASPPISVDCSGDVDLRGFFNTGHTDVVKMHNLQYQVSSGPNHGPEIEALVTQALRGSVSHGTIVRPTPITIGVVHNGVKIHQMVSNIDTIRGFMSEINMAAAAPPAA